MSRLESTLILFAVACGYFWYLSRGLPYWDDDYTRWLIPASQASWREVLTALVSPLASSAGDWGFLDRPLEMLCFKIAYAWFGTDAGPLYAFKGLAAAGATVCVYHWLRSITNDKRLAFGGAVFYMTTPAVVAAEVWACDFGVLSQFLFMLNAYLWRLQVQALESTSQKVECRWIVKTSLLTVLTFLSFKCKADLKLLPFVVLAAVALSDRRKLAVVGPWLALLIYAVVPWSADPFKALPPFAPGGPAASQVWMWQVPQVGGLWSLIWPESLTLRQPTPAVLASFGPLLVLPLIGAAVVGIWRRRRIVAGRWSEHGPLVVAWLVAMLLGAASLAVIPSFFRIRYGILLLPPMLMLVSIALAGASRAWRGVLLFALLGQVAVNGARVVRYRSDFGHLTNAVDKVYRAIDTLDPDAAVALLGGFLPFGPPPDAGAGLRARAAVKDVDALEASPARFPPGRTLVVTWEPMLSPRLVHLGAYDGCAAGSPFDIAFPCGAEAATAHLHRFVAFDQDLAAAEAARQAGDLAGELAFLDRVVAREPGHFYARFMQGLNAAARDDRPAMLAVYRALKESLPANPRVQFNLALALKLNGAKTEAIAAFEAVLAVLPGDRATLHQLTELRTAAPGS